ncbi:PaaI family thioesterase [Stappia taiwanensis]|nr:PaaI family thioesterase [Stappia taiwanensis]
MNKPMDAEALKAFAHQVFDAQPFSRYIGARLIGAAPGYAELSLEVTDNLKQQHGFVHGGVISYLADNAITFAGGLAMGGNALTSEFKINYLKPGRGHELIARARARSTGRRQAVCQCEIFSQVDGEEILCALAQGTIVAASD